jgi:hypothetical protein
MGLPRTVWHSASYVGAAWRADDGAARHRQSEALVEPRRDLAERDAELLIERHGECDRVRPQLDGRRAEGVGRLPRMTTLHPTVALRAAADMAAEAAHHRANGRKIFLVLIGHARLVHDAPQCGHPGESGASWVSSRRGGTGR